MIDGSGADCVGASHFPRTSGAVDRQLLARTLELAEGGAAAARPNPLVGAVLGLQDGTILAEGFHARRGAAHAERACLAAFGDGPVPRDATLYVSLEPCDHHGRTPPCSELLVQRGLRRVVFATCDPNPITAGLGPARLHAAGMAVLRGPREIEVLALQQNVGFQSAFLRGRPAITAKWAMTSDGGFATGDPERRWISGPASRDEVHRLRARSGAIVCGIGTVLADDPLLTVRGAAATEVVDPPLRVVHDRALRLPLESALVRGARDAAPVLVITDHRAPVEREFALVQAGVEVWRAPAPARGEACALGAALRMLSDRGVHDVLLEAGPALLMAYADADLVDRAIAFVAPHRATGDVPRLDLEHPLVRSVLAAAPTNSGDDQRHALDVHPAWTFPGAMSDG